MSYGKFLEHLFIQQFGGEPTDKYPLEQYEYRDIDVLRDGVGWSIKDQEISQRTGNLSFELELRCSATGETRPGNYAKCEADKYAIGCWVDGKKKWWIADVKEVKKFVGMGEKPEFKKKSLGFAAKATNTKRKFNDAVNILVPIKSLIENKIGHFKEIKCPESQSSPL